MKKLTSSDDFATRPIELPFQLRAQLPSALDAPAACVEHGWVTVSRHSTSLGTIVYSACASCGAHRTELLEPRDLFPVPISRSVSRPV